MQNEGQLKVKSLGKAIDVLNCFNVKQPLGVTEISTMLGVLKSSVHNILSTFEAMGYVEQEEDTGKYYLGAGIYALSRALGDKYTLDKLVQPYVKDLANITGESVIVSVPVGRKVQYIGGEYPDIPGVYTKLTYIGNSNDMYCTATGKAMLAFMTPEQRDMMLDCELIQRTPYTITDKQRLLDELSVIKERGYSTDHMEFQMNLSCMAAPLISPAGKLMGTFTISGPSERIEGSKAGIYSRFLVEYANKAGLIL